MRIKKQYLFLNKLAKGDGIVLWGSTALDNQPVNELMQNYHVSKNIYNRSIFGLTLKEAESFLEQCVFELSPSTLILNLGEEDIKCSENVTQMIEQYRWLLYKIHVALPNCQLVLTTVQGSGAICDCFNEELGKLAAEVGCMFYRIPLVSGKEEYGPVFLSTVKLSLYEKNLGYAQIADRAVFDLMMQ
ncbi:MAG: hypothetical protein J6K04_11600 [Lachnospiraceae bacterium]|nr:hypothetical protein [Lachnospiraceae bacterium]